MWAPRPVLFRGSLHWNSMEDGSRSNMIMVFNTTAESFREMPAPVVFCGVDLFEMDGMLAMSSFNDVATTIDIWMMQDYESEVWALKCRVELLVTNLGAQFGIYTQYRNVVATSWDGEVLVLAKFEDRLLQIDIHGKLVASFHCRGLDFS
ncbi:hypothetical protein VPH35_047432 [Triticum aestivum]|uniref:F-box associated domain-containing protein n=1 Tax=Triticum urartu TaxID=4572 RepID=A0A8R7U0E2_TRIUA